MGSTRAFVIVLMACAPGALSAQAVLHEQSGTKNGEGLGASVALAGDVNADGFVDIVVGAPSYSLNSTKQPGHALIFAGQTGAVLYEILGDADGDDLGRAVAAAGDVNGDGFADVIVGAPRADNGGLNSGLVRVISGATGGVLIELAGSATWDEFGSAVACAGDVDGDGLPDLIAGAPTSDLHGFSSGSARVFSGATGATLLLITGDAAYDLCGAAVAGAGDVDGDGRADLIVGSPSKMVGAVLAGSVRLISGATGQTLQSWHGAESGGDFGWAVAGAGDVDGDGVPDVAVGARLDSSAGENAGSVFLYSGATGALLRSFHGNQPGDAFGSSVFGAGDMDGDGRPELIVGAPHDHCEGGNCGAAAVFAGADGALLYEYHGELDEFMGASVGGGGDIDGDGFDDIVVGLPFASSPNGGNGAGLAREYSATSWLNLTLNGPGGAQALSHFSATGNLKPQQPFTLALSGVPPFAPSLLVVGLSVLDAPFKGATMVPHPDLVSHAILASAAGELTIAGLWPAGVPAGIDLTMQWWSLDAGTGSGFLSSNALQATIP